VWLGLFLNAFGKAVKYALFDPTKEMAYIPLDSDLKTTGKAAVDVIGGRGGKSLGSYVQMGALSVFHTSALYALVPIIGPVVIGVVVLWLLSVLKISTAFQKLTSEAEHKQKKSA
jgi:AAA family ATP:ADP antiporter